MTEAIGSGSLSRSADGAAEGRAVSSPSLSPDVRLSDEQLRTLTRVGVGIVHDMATELIASRAAIERGLVLALGYAAIHNYLGLQDVARDLRTALSLENAEQKA